MGTIKRRWRWERQAYRRRCSRLSCVRSAPAVEARVVRVARSRAVLCEVLSGVSFELGAQGRRRGPADGPARKSAPKRPRGEKEEKKWFITSRERERVCERERESYRES